MEQLGLLYSNTRALHKLVDNMPERAGKWTTRTLSFDDQPEDTFTIRYRDPIEAIRSLWGDPGLSKDFVYAPQKIFSDESKSKRIYNEMWTGKWWHVRLSGYFYI